MSPSSCSPPYYPPVFEISKLMISQTHPPLALTFHFNRGKQGPTGVNPWCSTARASPRSRYPTNLDGYRRRQRGVPRWLVGVGWREREISNLESVESRNPWSLEFGGIYGVNQTFWEFFWGNDPFLWDFFETGTWFRVKVNQFSLSRYIQLRNLALCSNHPQGKWRNVESGVLDPKL